MRVRYRLLVAAVPLVLTLALLVLAAIHHEAAAPGTAPEYWNRLCALGPPETHRYAYESGSGVYPPYRGSAYYYDQLHHERRLYVVPMNEIVGEVRSVSA